MQYTYKKGQSYSCAQRIKHYAMKAYGGVDIYNHIFLTSVLVGGEWSASHPGRFTPGERAPDAHWTGCWVGPRAGLDDVERENFLPWRDLNAEPPVVHSVASRYTNCAIPASIMQYICDNSVVCRSVMNLM
jgi:hypothetical protein